MLRFTNSLIQFPDPRISVRRRGIPPFFLVILLRLDRLFFRLHGRDLFIIHGNFFPNGRDFGIIGTDMFI